MADGVFGGNQGPIQEGNRRSAHRYKAAGRGPLRVEIRGKQEGTFDDFNLEEAFLSQPRDVSNTGLSFLHDKPVERDANVLLAFLGDDELSMPIEGEVVKSRLLYGTTYHVGVRFKSPIDVKVSKQEDQKIRKLSDMIAKQMD